MDVKEVREILERGLDKDRHQKFSDAMECMTTHRWYWRWAQDLESNCKDALAALSAIDPEDNALKVGRHFCSKMPCSPSDCDGIPCRYMEDAVANRNNRDPEAIRLECARAARNAIFNFGIDDKAPDYYSPIIRKDLAVQLVERAILSAEPAQDDGKAEVKSIGGANTFDELIGLMEIARNNKTGITLDWVEVGIIMRAAELRRRIEESKQ